MQTTIGNMNVFVSPALAGEKVCYLGVLGSDSLTGTGLFCPYIPLLPTQLLGYADGKMEQGLTNATMKIA